MRRAALIALALVGVAGCAAMRAERGRMLPAHRGATVAYVALGDSTVAGVGATSPLTTYVSRLHGRLRHQYPAARVANLGVPGATSADVLDGQLDRAIEMRPALVTLSIGPNDITGRVPVAAYTRNVETIFERLRDDTAAVVVANLLPDLAVTPRFRGTPHEAEVGRMTRAFNDVLAAAARRYGVEIVDLYEPSRAEVPRQPELVASDGYHPSDLGYARWTELLWAGVARRIPPRE